VRDGLGWWVRRAAEELTPEDDVLDAQAESGARTEPVNDRETPAATIENCSFVERSRSLAASRA
jgi:hypothetical protein